MEENISGHKIFQSRIIQETLELQIQALKIQSFSTKHHMISHSLRSLLILPPVLGVWFLGNARHIIAGDHLLSFPFSSLI